MITIDLVDLQKRLRDARTRLPIPRIARFLGVRPRELQAFMHGIVRLQPKTLIRLDAVLSLRVPQAPPPARTPHEQLGFIIREWEKDFGREPLWRTLRTLWRCAENRPSSCRKWLPEGLPDEVRSKRAFAIFVRKLDFRYRRWRSRSFQWRYTWQAKVKDNMPLGLWLRLMISRESEKRRKSLSEGQNGQTSGGQGSAAQPRTA